MKCSNLGHVNKTNNDWRLLTVSVYTNYIQATIIAAIRNVEAKDMGMVLIRPQYLRMIYSAVQEGTFCETRAVQACLCYLP
jgi:hypothetical protein